MTTINDILAATAETSSTLAVADFIAQPRIIPRTASLGAGQKLGSATFDILIGDGRLLATETQGTMAGLDYSTYFEGKLVRIVYDSAAIWYGIFSNSFQTSQGGSNYGAQTLSAEELSTTFRKAYVRRGVEQSITTGVVETLSVPAFNAYPNGDRADDALVWYHDRTGLGVPWTAKQALEYVLEYNYDLATVTVNAIGNCLDYILPESNFTGLTVWDVVNTIANQRRGLTWTLDVDDSGATLAFTLTVKSIAANSVTSSSGYVLPAAPSPVSFDGTASNFLECAISVSDAAAYDRIRVVGNRPLVGITLSYSELAPAWTAAQETAYGADSEDPEGEYVYRSYGINGSWNWSQYNEAAVGIANTLSTDTVGAGSVTVYNGDRSYDSTGSIFPAASLEISGLLPASINWGNDKQGERQRAIMLWDDSGTWVDVSGAQDGVSPLSLVVNAGDNGQPIITIGGAADRDTLKVRHVDNGDDLLITLAFREPYPLMIEKAQETMPLVERVLEYVIPARYEYMLQGTVKGHVGGSTLDTYSANEVIVDERSTMEDVLALLWAYYGEPSVQVSFTLRGLITDAVVLGTGKVGDLVRNVTTSFGTITCNNVIASVSWDFSEGGMATRFETMRFIPDVGAVL